MSAQSPDRSRKGKARRDGIGKISAPFVKDTGVIIEKFVEAVKDLFQYCYTDADLYQEIHKMEDDELFASLSEYLEEIKFGVFEALSDNLDKISLKFLQLCDKQENFNKYLKVLKDRWKNSSSMNSLHRHDNRHIRSAKQYVNKLAASDAAKSKSPRIKSPIKPQLHNSDYETINKVAGSRPSTSRQYQTQSVSSIQDMPLNESRGASRPDNQNTRISQTPAREFYSANKSVSSVGHPESPRRPSATKRSTYSAVKGGSPLKSARKTGSRERTPEIRAKEDKMVVKSTDHGTFSRDLLDPQLNPRIKCIWPADQNRAFLGLELGKIVEIIPERNKTPQQKSVVFSGTHTIYDLVMDCKDRLLFFDASFVLRMISYNSSKTVEVCQGEYWGSSSH